MNMIGHYDNAMDMNLSAMVVEAMPEYCGSDCLWKLPGVLRAKGYEVASIFDFEMRKMATVRSGFLNPPLILSACFEVSFGQFRVPA